ncbi:hypothetical protein NPIL_394241, partial [Nephila pilipes]
MVERAKEGGHKQWGDGWESLFRIGGEDAEEGR